MKLRNLFPLVCGVVIGVAHFPASAQILFQDNFDADSTANWTVNGGPSDEFADFFFDYSTVGIPSAPNSGGTTRGLKMYANHTDGIFGGFSVSPTGQSFSGDYELRFDLWINFNGPAPLGGSGSTQLTGAGIGSTGTTAQWPGAATKDGVWFASTGDGGSAADYRAYSTAAPTSYAAGNAVYAAPGGAINNSDAYYASLGGNTPPAAQTALFPQQTGTSAAGAPAFAWHDVSIVKAGNTITWSIDGLLIATIDTATVTLAGENILFMYSDINATSSTDPNDIFLLFGLIDNVTVMAVPEPSFFALGLLGIAGIYVARRRQK